MSKSGIDYFCIIVIFSLLLCAGSGAQEVAGSENSGANGAGYFLLNEISPFSGPGTTGPWVELINPTDTAVPLDGWTILFQSGWEIKLQNISRECPPGGIVLITTGTAIDLPNTNETVTVIDGGSMAQTNSDGDGCVLTGPQGPVDTISWGIYHPQQNTEISSGPPLVPLRGFYAEGDSVHNPGDVLIRRQVSLIASQVDVVGSDHWDYRSVSEESPGASNPPPQPVWFSPSDGAEIASDFNLYIDGFDWTTHTTFQLSRDEGFSGIEMESTVEGNSLLLDSIDPGIWFWRVRGYENYPENPGPWSSTHNFLRESFDIDAMIALEDKDTGVKASGGGGQSGAVLTASYTVPTIQKCQRKDSRMLCLDGCEMSGTCSWCGDHPTDLSCKHGGMYCTRCSVSMMASAGGFDLSQDRITYYMFEEAGTSSTAATSSGHLNDPYGDLGHNVGTWSADCPLIVSWIYGQPKSASKEVFYHEKIFYDDSPAMDSIVEFIMDGRTILRHCAWHTTLLTGAGIVEENGVQKYFIQVYDTAPPGNIKWLSLESTKTIFNEFTFPPVTGQIIRGDEPEFSMDSDSDGLTDFDETRRFYTDPYDDDTDGDGITDRNDILGYMFDLYGEYLPRERDIDGDGKPKELDPDNDDPSDSSMNDGCEDADNDGLYNMFERETDCFSAGDDLDMINTDCYRGYVRIEVIQDVDIPIEGFTMFDNSVEMVLIENAPMDSTDYVHTHTWSRLLDADDKKPVHQFAADGSSTLRGNAMVILEKNPNTGVYTIITDVDTVNEDFTWTSEFPSGGGSGIGWNPTIFFFANSEYGNPTYELGEPIESNGGLLLVGEYEMFGEMGFENPFSTLTMKWEIWLSPPDN